MEPDFITSNPMMMDSTMGSAGAFGGGIVVIIIQLAVYIFLAYCQFTLSKKMNIQYSWMAFIPLLSGINLLWIAGKSLGKYISLAILFLVMIIGGPILVMFGGPLAAILTPIGFLGMIGLSLAILDGVAKRTGHGFFWALGLLILYPVMLPITAFTYKPVAASQTTPAQ